MHMHVYSMLQDVIPYFWSDILIYCQSIQIFSHCEPKTSSDAPVGMQILHSTSSTYNKKYILKMFLSFACIPLLCKYKVV